MVIIAVLEIADASENAQRTSLQGRHEAEKWFDFGFDQCLLSAPLMLLGYIQLNELHSYAWWCQQIVIQVLICLAQQTFVTNWPSRDLDVKEEEANDEESLDLQNPLPEGLAEEDANETEENPMPDDALEEGSFLYSWVVEGSSYLSTTAAPAITEALDMIESVRSRTFVSIYGGGTGLQVGCAYLKGSLVLSNRN